MEDLPALLPEYACPLPPIRCIPANERETVRVKVYKSVLTHTHTHTHTFPSSVAEVILRRKSLCSGSLA